MDYNLKFFEAAYREIVEFIGRSLREIDKGSIESFVQHLVRAYNTQCKVIVVGVGRSGLVGRGFAMRLRHLNISSYVLGETITPSIGKGDMLVAISGSGSTQIVVAAAEAAKRVGATVVAITSYPDSPLGNVADLVIKLPGRTKLAPLDDYFTRQILGIHEPLSPLGTLFEDTAMVMLDAVIAEVMHRLGINEDELRKMHANIEFI